MGAPAGRIDVPQDGWAFDPDTIFHRLIDAGETWSDKEAAAQIWEETRKPLLSKLGTDSMEKSESAKERVAYASETYRDHVEKMVEARRHANRAKVQYIAIQALAEMLRTRESTRRAEMNLAR